MNTLLETRASVTASRQWSAAPARRLTPADRLALRIGLALVLWARRPLAPEPEALRRRAAHARAIEARRNEAERAHRLLLPPR